MVYFTGVRYILILNFKGNIMKSLFAIVASVFAVSAFAQAPAAPAKKEEAKPAAAAPAKKEDAKKANSKSEAKPADKKGEAAKK